MLTIKSKRNQLVLKTVFIIIKYSSEAILEISQINWRDTSRIGISIPLNCLSNRLKKLFTNNNFPKLCTNVPIDGTQLLSMSDKYCIGP